MDAKYSIVNYNCLLSLHLFQKYITLTVRNGYNNTAIADATFIAKIEDETIKKGLSDSDGKIELGPFAARDIVTVKVEKLDSDIKLKLTAPQTHIRRIILHFLTNISQITMIQKYICSEKFIKSI